MQILIPAIHLAREQVAKLALLADAVTPGAERMSVLETFQPLMDVEKHYRRKEQLVFSVLERHGTGGPSKVMWDKDDEVRELLKSSLTALREETLTGAELKILRVTVLAPALAALESMIYKEENILFPMTLGLFTEEEWGKIFHQNGEYGWCLVSPASGYQPPQASAVKDVIQLPAAQAARVAGIALPTLINMLRRELGQTMAEAGQATGNLVRDTWPTWFSPDAVVAELEVVKILADGGHPLAWARLILKAHPVGSIVVLISDFEPTPLLSLVEQEGLLAACHRDGLLYRTALKRLEV